MDSSDKNAFAFARRYKANVKRSTAQPLSSAILIVFPTNDGVWARRWQQVEEYCWQHPGTVFVNKKKHGDLTVIALWTDKYSEILKRQVSARFRKGLNDHVERGAIPKGYVGWYNYFSLDSDEE